MRVLVSGSRGFIGSALVEFLQSQGHEIKRLVRSASVREDSDFVWDLQRRFVDPKAFEGCDAVVHLAAENVAGRWTDQKKRKIRQSRIEGAKVICDAIQKLDKKPEVYISASGVGYYGDRGNEVIAEGQPCGNFFLSEVARDREAVSAPLRQSGIRVVSMRFGMVLGNGGPLKKMLGSFKLGLGAKFGSGRQYWSWVTREDAVRAIVHAIQTESLNAPINVVSPLPVTNSEFAGILAKVLSKPQFLTLPACLARLMFGELADNLLLCSIRAEPESLINSGFVFAHPELEEALRCILS